MINPILSLALRPKTLSSLIGQKSIVEAIRRQVAKRLPHAWMFNGSSGSGKTSIARIIAMSLQCSHQKLWGDPCENCRKESFCIHEINASETSGVEDLGKIAVLSRHVPTSGKYRVIILDEAQIISTQGQNLLLKDFEDTPITTQWIICTTDPRKIIAALQRRTMRYQMNELTWATRQSLIERAAKYTQFAGDGLTGFLEAANLAELSAGASLMAFERFTSGMPPQQAVIGGETSIDPLRVCRAVINGKWPDLKAALQDATSDDARWIRASVCGFLRSCLLKENDPKRRVAISDSMLELTGMAPLEDGLLAHWLLAVLYRSCKRISSATS